MIRAGVYGASGYIGGELLRLLLGHPEVDIVSAVSSRLSGRRVDTAHPNLRGSTDLLFCAPADVADCDVIFLAVSPSVAMDLVPELAGKAPVIIDLSGGFRLRDPEVFARYYGEHTRPELLEQFVTGWPERYRKELLTADRISMPGCMANAATLALYPLAAEGLIRPDVTIDGRVGSSGSGVSADAMNLHAERSGAMRVFKPQRAPPRGGGRAGHRPDRAHERDRCGSRARRPGADPRVGRRRCHARRTGAAQALPRVLRGRAVRPDRRAEARPVPAAQLKILNGSNFCDIGFATDPDDGSAVLIAALDNLVKGGAGNAVQTMNIRFGRPETLGLGFTGLHPV